MRSKRCAVQNQGITLTQHPLAYDCGGIQTIILTKVEEGLDHVQSTGFSFIISTSDYSRVTIGGATFKIP